MHTSHRLLAIAALGLGTFAAACAVDATSSPLAPSTHASFAIAAVDPCSPDLTAPVITSLSASPNTLWAPNHKMNTVTVTWAATDNCGTPTCNMSATSNEPVNGLGDGNTAPDITKVDANTLLLRSERSGLGSGRVYTIGVTCTDAAGNATTSYTTVTVAHDQGKRG